MMVMTLVTCKCGIKNMEVGGNVDDIYDSGGDAEGTEVDGGISNTKKFADINNTFIVHMVEHMNATQNTLAPVVVVITSRAPPVASESILIALDSTDLLFNDTCGTPCFVIGRIAL